MVTSSNHHNPNFTFSEERIRIAREFHDGIGQDLVAIGYRLDAVIGRSSLDQQSRGDLRELRELLSQLTNRVREEIFLLRKKDGSPLLTHITLAMAEIFLDSEFRATITGDSYDLTDIEITELVKSICECARNAKRHSQGSNFTVFIDAALIQLHDDGIGGLDFDSDRHGLKGVLERLNLIGWSFTYDVESNLITFAKVLP